MSAKKNKTSKTRRKPPQQQGRITLDGTPRPRILVLEGLSGSERAVMRSGGIPIRVSPRSVEQTVRALEAGLFDGLLLTGGGDVDPRRYGARPHKQVYGVNQTRDELELLALDRAAELNVPVLGICRGMQLINVHAGGKLKQHITGHRGTSHLVVTEDDSTARGATQHVRLKCVSLHHQCILKVGRGFRVTGRALDRTPEIIESTDGRVLGVQYHPEMDFSSNLASANVFDWLVERAASRLGYPFPATPYRPPVVERPYYERQTSAVPRTPRRAGERTRPKDQSATPFGLTPRKPYRPPSDVKVSWLCPKCGLRFEDHDDREDHILEEHGGFAPEVAGHREQLTLSERGPYARAVEPPPGHPDWD
jgi:putative glutamine amidotransferase